MDKMLYFQQTQAQRTIVRDMSGEDPLKLNLWLKDKKKSNRNTHKKRTQKIINSRVQYDETDVSHFEFIGEDDIGTSDMYKLNVKTKVNFKTEANDYDG